VSQTKAPKDAAKKPVPAKAPAGFDDLAARVTPHAGKLAAAAGIIVVGAFAFLGWRWYSEREAGKATWAFAEVIDKATARVEAGATPSESDEPSFPTGEARAQAALAQLATFEQQHGGTDVANRTLLVKASLLFDLGRFDEAVEQYERFLARDPDPVAAFVAREGKGYAREAKALALTDAAQKKAALAPAAAAFKDIQTDPKGRFYASAAYHQGRIAALQGLDSAAVDLFKKALAARPGYALEEQIKGRLALLEQKSGGMPTPVPAK
jgi:tetratricopeptide (TPR) repeat protein